MVRTPGTRNLPTMKDGVPLKPNASACSPLRARMASIALALAARSRSSAIHVDAGAGEQFADARLGQFRADADHRLMRRHVLVLIFGWPAPSAPRSTETSPRIGQSFSTRRTLPSSCTTCADLGRDLAAIGAIVVEPFDDGDVAIGIAGRGDIGIAQHQRFGQHLVAALRRAPVAMPRRAARRRPPSRPSASRRVVPDRSRPDRSIGSCGSRDRRSCSLSTPETGICYAPAYRAPPQ